MPATRSLGFTYSIKREKRMIQKIFLHGLESSSKGFKGRYFAELFPEMLLPDFNGSLESRLEQLEDICREGDDFTLVGSSFGGLMATCYAMSHQDRLKKLILLAPALNFANFSPPAKGIDVPTTLLIGKRDTVTPPDEVIPLARQTFTHLEIYLFEDDHMMHETFIHLDWTDLLEGEGLV